MSKTDHQHNMDFEAEVRVVAEAIWGLSPGECQPSHYPNNPHIQELDGIVRLRDVVHLIMATTSTRLEKAKDDVKKLNAAELHEGKDGVAISKWFITEKQLDAQHIEYARKSKVIAITLNQLRRRFFDGSKYIKLRKNSSFGSARDPNTDSITIDDRKYVQLPITLIADKLPSKPLSFCLQKSVLIDSIIKCIIQGKIAILIAPFGSGKSITTRQIFLRLAEQHRVDGNEPVPFTLNLREHWGQVHADEILDRHGRSIGYSPKEDLTIAWRSGVATLILDGFDEVASQTIMRRDDITFMRAARRDALSGVRDFLSKIPAGIGAFICGRDHYFDDEKEVADALAIGSKNVQVFRLGEFSEDGVREFLEKNGVSKNLPDWLPRKPLLLGYLIQKELIDEIVAIDGRNGFAHAWDTFLAKITEREADLESSTMASLTLRAVMERIAFMMRERPTKDGPVTGTDLSNAFNLETGQSASEGVLAQLQRLPGLTQRDKEPGSRSFVDEDMLSALQGGAFYRLIVDNFKSNNTLPIAEISPRAIEMAAYLLQKSGYTTSTLVAVVLGLARQKSRISNVDQILADLVMVVLAVANNEGIGSVNFDDLIVDSGIFGKINLEEIALHGLTLQECIIVEVLTASNVSGYGIRFNECLIQKIGGVGGELGLPKNIFLKCTVEHYDEMSTTNAVLQLNLAPQLKALITVLRKLFKQAGGGRQMNALHRGITQRQVLDYIDKIVGILESEGVVFVTGNVVHPVRKNIGRIDNILIAPLLSCLVSCDHIPRRSMPLLRAKAVLDELIAGFPKRSPTHRSSTPERQRA
ncbi:NACHT domain-containing protein [Pseudoduganella namucuonensis]|uniref:NACHT domain-containing protein n=1 Tax=Pseudoduganella namucuonensis TaxID=1035707 RepID=A0A1I7L1B1_9BURK|nr:hypothetical protein [Pseudoduganella namucuonensis]SFV03529.1 hypothetical protein SAMN05216552_10222 [Pseudoduganella namucuonensis]